MPSPHLARRLAVQQIFLSVQSANQPGTPPYWRNPDWFYLNHMPQAGIEPTTLALGVLCSVHLSYWGNEEIIPNSCFSSYPLLYYKVSRE